MTHWTDEQTRLLIALFHEGVSDRAIAAVIGRPTSGVEAKRKSLGLKRQQGGGSKQRIAPAKPSRAKVSFPDFSTQEIKTRRQAPRTYQPDCQLRREAVS